MTERSMYSEAQSSEECGVADRPVRGSGLLALRLPEKHLPLVQYIEPAGLPEMLASSDTIIVDVRTLEERSDGHISGSLHVPTGEWLDAEPQPRGHEELCNRAGLAAGTVPHLVFHCMYSRERAPRCARAALDAWAEYVRISILRGGFQQCMTTLFPTRPEVFTCVRIERWIEHGSQGLVWLPDADPFACLEDRLQQHLQEQLEAESIGALGKEELG